MEALGYLVLLYMTIQLFGALNTSHAAKASQWLENAGAVCLAFFSLNC